MTTFIPKFLKPYLLTVATVFALPAFMLAAPGDDLLVHYQDVQAAPAESVHDHYHTGRADSHAPLPVMGDHTHGANEWMLSYRYQYMEMDGLLNGDNEVDKASGFMKTPKTMKMYMQMVGLMYAPTDRLTLMAMMMHHRKSMESLHNNGTWTRTKVDGFGDTTLGGLYKFYETPKVRMHLNFGIGLPTGSIDETGGGTTRLGYPMQMGSGTYDLLPGITYLGQSANWSWGMQAKGTIRMDRNDHDYSLGDRFETQNWFARNWSDSFSTSIRFSNEIWGNVDGKDTGMMADTMMPTVREDMQGGFRTELGLGMNFNFKSNLLQGHRLALEFVTPLYEDLDGYQMKRDWWVMIGWQKAF
ncbi:MAG: hypothetical protein VX705_00240 [Verrucomicrobiota bacterium]|nr:hypothetical protein [Verrucomicrobiota bacterium]